MPSRGRAHVERTQEKPLALAHGAGEGLITPIRGGTPFSLVFPFSVPPPQAVPGRPLWQEVSPGPRGLGNGTFLYASRAEAPGQHVDTPGIPLGCTCDRSEQHFRRLETVRATTHRRRVGTGRSTQPDRSPAHSKITFSRGLKDDPESHDIIFKYLGRD